MFELDLQHYRAIMESLPNGVYVVDTDRRIVFWNDGAERITGYLRQQVINRRCPETPLRHCDENQVNLCDGECLVDRTLRDGRPREADLYLCHKDGQRVPVRAHVVALHDSDGTIIGAAESFEQRYPGLELPLHAHASTVDNHLDRLTGVSDHQTVRSYLEACLADFGEDAATFGILSIAIDGFRLFRGARGRPAAARVLHAMAETLSKNLPKGGIVGRWAEDRFVVILVDCPPPALARRAAVLQQIVQSTAISWWGDRLALTLSLGGTTAHPGDTVDSMLERAEQALLAGVASGKRVEIL